MRIIIGILFVLCLTTINLKSQQPSNGKSNQTKGEGKISGILIDEDNKKPLPGAKVVLYQYTDSTLVKGAITDTKGNFTLDNLPLGRFNLKISSLGYASRQYPVLISEKRKEFKLGNIILSAKAINTNEVEVTANKEMIQTNLDKKVFFVDKNIVSSGGSALDVLQNIPSVSVDIDGNVSLRGSGDIKFLVDGKPSGLTGSDLLEMIPASAIETVELITNPSAKYDPEGASGIINIVLKKKQAEGLNGIISLSAGTGDKYSTSINLNYRYEFINVFANYDNHLFAMTGYGNSYKTSSYLDSLNNTNTSYTNQNSDFFRHGRFHNFKIGTDINITDSDILTLSTLYNFGGRSSKEFDTYNDFDMSNILTQNSNKTSNENFSTHGFDYLVSYKKILGKKQHELTADFFYSPRFRDNESYINQNYYDLITTSKIDSMPLQKSSTNSNSTNLSFQVDYSQPFSVDGRFDAGYKFSYRTSDQDYNFFNFDNNSTIWINNQSISNHFIYDETFHALYAIYGNSIANFNYQLGLRGEQTLVSSDQKTTSQQFKSNYFSLFPTIHLKYSFTEFNSLQLSYSRRINRPNWRQINPFIDYEDPRNLEQGNPNLSPEYMNSLEFGHLLYINKATINTTLFYRQTDGVITNIRTSIDSLRTMTTFQNLLNSHSYGLELIYQQDVYKWWRYDANLSYFRLNVKGSYQNIDLSSDNYSWTGRFNTNFNVISIFDIQFSANYSAPITSAQVRTQERYSADMAVKANLMAGKLSFTLKLSDIFNTQKYISETYGTNFYIDSFRRRASRILSLSATYRINDYKKPKEKKNGNGDTEEYD